VRARSPYQPGRCLTAGRWTASSASSRTSPCPSFPRPLSSSVYVRAHCSLLRFRVALTTAQHKKRVDSLRSFRSRRVCRQPLCPPSLYTSHAAHTRITALMGIGVLLAPPGRALTGTARRFDASAPVAPPSPFSDFLPSRGCLGRPSSAPLSHHPMRPARPLLHSPCRRPSLASDPCWCGPPSVVGMSSDFLFIRSPPSLKRPRPPPLPLDHAGGVLASQLQVPDEPPWIVKSLPTPPLKSALSRPGSPRWRSSEDVLRFDESRVEVIPTWSADDYSRCVRMQASYRVDLMSCVAQHGTRSSHGAPAQADPSEAGR
jgi:hypothetical protein